MVLGMMDGNTVTSLDRVSALDCLWIFGISLGISKSGNLTGRAKTFISPKDYNVLIHSPTVLTSCANSGQTISVAASFCSLVKPAVVSLSIVT
jgi:hypothetical protein